MAVRVDVDINPPPRNVGIPKLDLNHNLTFVTHERYCDYWHRQFTALCSITINNKPLMIETLNTYSFKSSVHLSVGRDDDVEAATLSVTAGQIKPAKPNKLYNTTVHFWLNHLSIGNDHWGWLIDYLQHKVLANTCKVDTCWMMSWCLRSYASHECVGRFDWFAEWVVDSAYVAQPRTVAEVLRYLTDGTSY